MCGNLDIHWCRERSFIAFHKITVCFSFLPSFLLLAWIFNAWSIYVLYHLMTLICALETNLTPLSPGFMPLLMTQPFPRSPDTEAKYCFRDPSSILLHCPHYYWDNSPPLPVCHVHLPFNSSYTSPSLTSSLHNIRDLFFPPIVCPLFGLSFPYALITLATVSANALCPSPQLLGLIGERVKLHRLSLWQAQLTYCGQYVAP